MNKEKIKEVMSYLGKRSIEVQHGKKTKKQRSEHFRKISLKRWENEKPISTKIQRKGKVV